MPTFQAICATTAKHDEWGCQGRGSQEMRKVTNAQATTLLAFVGKTLVKNYPKGKPKFCVGCREHLVEVRPDLFKEDTTQTEHNYPQQDLDEPPAKRQFIAFVSTGPATCPASLPGYGQGTSRNIETNTVSQQTDSFVSCETSTQTDDVYVLSSEMEVKDLPRKVLVKLAFELGRYLNHELRQDSDNLSSHDTKQLSTLSSLNIVDYLHARSETLVSFLHGVSKTGDVLDMVSDNDKGVNKNRYKLIKTVESVMNLTGIQFVFPVHLRESVLINSIGSLSLSMQVLSSNSPYASYQTVKTWLDKLGTTTHMSLKGDILAVFDNNQTMSRRWRVRLHNKMFCNVVTIVAFFSIDNVGMIQCTEEYKPGIWFLKELTDRDIQGIRECDKESEVKSAHYNRHLYPMWAEAIAAVANDQTRLELNGAMVYEDIIDNMVKEKEEDSNFKRCYDCGQGKIALKKIKCPSCKTNLKQSKMRFLGMDEKLTYTEKPKKSMSSTSKHFRLNVSQESGSCSITYEEVVGDAQTVPSNEYTVTEPVFVNPCSYEAVVSVMKHIGEKGGIPKYNNGVGDRCFIPIFCDGSPYNLCFRTITCTYRCAMCQNTQCGLKSLKSHMLNVHDVSNDDVNDEHYSLEFDWVLLQPGAGHLEMNMLKGLTELCWSVFWCTLAKTMNFTSEKALLYCKKVSDHHKGWQLLTIAHEALTRELIVPFVREELGKDEPNLSPVQFAAFLKLHVRDSTYLFIADIVFEFMGALLMFRKGIRHADNELFLTGLRKFAKLWSGRHHPLYRELEMSFSVTLARMPSELRRHVLQCWSLNTSGIAETNEGPDFKLEAINKTLQHWLPANPDGKDWKQVCCQHDDLAKLRKNVYEQMGIQDPKIRRKQSHQAMSEEICAFRCVLRQKKYLSSPRTPRGLVALDGVTELDQELKDFCKLSRITRAKYFDEYMSYEQHRSVIRTTIPFKAPPVHVTMEERSEYERAERKTVLELKSEVYVMLDSIADDDVHESFRDAWHAEVLKRPGSKRKDVAAFHEELANFLENINIASGELQEPTES